MSGKGRIEWASGDEPVFFSLPVDDKMSRPFFACSVFFSLALLRFALSVFPQKNKKTMLGPLRAALRGAGARASSAASPATAAARRGYAAGEFFPLRLKLRSRATTR